jgi:hypothetical protein
MDNMSQAREFVTTDPASAAFRLYLYERTLRQIAEGIDCPQERAEEVLAYFATESSES